MHFAFGSSTDAGANLDSRLRDELDVTNPGEEGTNAYALKIVREGIANETIPSTLTLKVALSCSIDSQFKPDQPGMEV